MNVIFSKPYKPIWLTIPIILGLTILGFNSAIDLQVHDTYFIFGTIHIGIAFSIVLAIAGILYWLTKNKKLIDWMTAIHVIITISSFILIVIASLIFRETIGSDYDKFRTANQIHVTIVLTSLFSQLVFIVNLTISLIRKKE